MKTGLTQFTLVLDRSGSMESIKDATIAGVNEFILAQKHVPSEANIYAVKFDTEYEIIYEGSLGAMPLLDGNSYQPRANTALHDAIGRAITHTGQTLASQPEQERAEKVIFAIMTDGLENASREYDREKIAQMVKLQREIYKWEFLYLGANQDAVLVGEQLNIPRSHSVTYTAAPANVMSVIRGMSRNTQMYRQGVGGASAMAFTNEQRNEAVIADDVREAAK